MSLQYSAMREIGVTELVGKDAKVDQNDYGASVGVTFEEEITGELLSFAFFATEDGDGAVQDSAGWLYIFDANPAITAGDTAITNAEWLTLIGKVEVEAGDWTTDANGGCAYVSDQPVPFHGVGALYFAWFHTDATGLNDAGGDDEQLEFNAWYRRDS